MNQRNKNLKENNSLEIKIDKSETLSNKAKYRVPFGTVSITDDAHKLMNQAIKSKLVTRG